MIMSSQNQQEINKGFLTYLWLDKALREEAREFLNSMNDQCSTVFITSFFMFIIHGREMIEQRIAKLRMKRSARTKFIDLLIRLQQTDVDKHVADYPYSGYCP